MVTDVATSDGFPGSSISQLPRPDTPSDSVSAEQCESRGLCYLDGQML